MAAPEYFVVVGQRQADLRLSGHAGSPTLGSVTAQFVVGTWMLLSSELLCPSRWLLEGAGGWVEVGRVLSRSDETHPLTADDTTIVVDGGKNHS
jgi:hypothetical protein